MSQITNILEYRSKIKKEKPETTSTSHEMCPQQCRDTFSDLNSFFSKYTLEKNETTLTVTIPF